MSVNLKGIYLPIITPFMASDVNKVDEGILSELIEYSINTLKVSGIAPCGTTGEAPVLAHEEHLEVIKMVIDKTNKRVPVMAATGSNSTSETIYLSKKAEEYGADMLLVVVPYYNKPGQRALLKHFEQVAASVNIPIVLYDIPGRTGISIHLDTYKELIKIDNIIGVKHAPVSFMDTVKLLDYIRNHTDGSFSVLCGEDALTFSMVALGAKGGVTAAAHIIGAEYQEMCELIFANKIDEAQKIFYKTIDIVNLAFCESNPAPIKYMMTKRGFPVNLLRAPLDSISKESEKLIDAALEKLGNN